MISTPRVSVVMGVHNPGPQLTQTIDSVLGQTFSDLELIVVDDGSTDHSRQLLLDYAQSDARLVVVHQAHAGLTSALCRGCGVARGEFIVRHDAGDWSSADRIERQVAAMDNHSSVAFAACWTEFVGPEGEYLYTATGADHAHRPIALPPIWVAQGPGCTIGPSSHPAVIMRRQAYFDSGGYRTQFRLAQDWDLWYRLAGIGDFMVLDEALYHACFRLGDSSMSKRKLQHRLGDLARVAFDSRVRGASETAILARAAELSTLAVPSASAREKASGAYFLGSCLRQNGDRRARHYFIQATRLDPWHWRAWWRRWQTQVG